MCIRDSSKLSQGVKEAPVHLVAGKLHKEIRETEQDNVGAVSYTHLDVYKRQDRRPGAGVGGTIL